jgi:hypothetical protein
MDRFSYVGQGFASGARRGAGKNRGQRLWVRKADRRLTRVSVAGFFLGPLPALRQFVPVDRDQDRLSRRIRLFGKLLLNFSESHNDLFRIRADWASVGDWENHWKAHSRMSP